MFGATFELPPRGSFPCLECLMRESRDQVKTDIVKTRLPQQCEGRPCVICIMSACQQFQ